MEKEKNIWWDKSITLVEGCTPVSAGCSHCWSAGMAHRFRPELTTDGYFNGKIICREDRLGEILKRKKPTRWTIWNDLFHPSVPFDFIDEVWWTMSVCREHIFQVLTKRPKRFVKYWQHRLNKGFTDGYRENIWCGVTVEHPDYKNRIDILRQIPAAVRFLSIEPCLGDMGELNLEGIHQVIVGGESGPGARPMHPDWARGVRDQCVAAGVPFFFKQWGAWLSGDEKYKLRINTYQGYYPKRVTRIGKTTFFKVGKKKAGRRLDGRTWDELPELAGKAGEKC